MPQEMACDKLNLLILLKGLFRTNQGGSVSLGPLSSRLGCVHSGQVVCGGDTVPLTVSWDKHDTSPPEGPPPPPFHHTPTPTHPGLSPEDLLAKLACRAGACWLVDWTLGPGLSSLHCPLPQLPRDGKDG